MGPSLTLARIALTILTFRGVKSQQDFTPDHVLCLCDLWVDVCDPNCCCDAFCSEGEKAAFTECLPGHRVVDTGMCTQTRSICSITSISTTSSTNATSSATRTTSSCSNYTYSSPSLFCVYFNNSRDAGLNVSPSPAWDKNSLAALLSARGASPSSSSLSFSPSSPSPSSSPSSFSPSSSSFAVNATVAPTADEPHRSGDPIVIQNKILTLPWKLMGQYCSNSNPGGFLMDRTGSCLQPLVNLCRAGSALDLNSVAGSAKITVLRKRVGVGGANVVVTLPANLTAGDLSPQSSGDLCENALLEVHFTVHYNVSGRVTSVSVDATVGTVSMTDVNVLQTFSLTHQILDQSPVPVSGNPGYVVGKPLRAGILNGSTVLEWPVTSGLPVTSDLHVTSGLPVPLSAVPWDCVGGGRGATRTTQFGIHSRAGCRLSLRSTAAWGVDRTVSRSLACTLLAQDELLGRLLQHGASVVRVAAYGNASNAVPDDWVAVQSDAVGVCPDDLCAVDVVVTVLWTRVGSLVNSQAKVLGVRVKQSYNRATQGRCASDLWLDLTSTVTFVELPSPALAMTRAVPTIDARLPTDLFFPFLQNSAAPCPSYTLVTVMAAVLALLVGVANT